MNTFVWTTQLYDWFFFHQTSVSKSDLFVFLPSPPLSPPVCTPSSPPLPHPSTPPPSPGPLPFYFSSVPSFSSLSSSSSLFFSSSFSSSSSSSVEETGKTVPLLPEKKGFWVRGDFGPDGKILPPVAHPDRTRQKFPLRVVPT